MSIQTNQIISDHSLNKFNSTASDVTDIQNKLLATVRVKIDAQLTKITELQALLIQEEQLLMDNLRRERELSEQLGVSITIH